MIRDEHGRAAAWVLAFVLAAGIGLGGLMAVGCAIGANACPFRHRPAATATDGRSLWLTNCAACHGLDASGATGPSLVSGPAAGLGQAELRSRIADGKPLAGMPAFKRGLSAAQIATVADYLLGLRSAGGGE